MYEDFRADPVSVDESTRDFFERWSLPADVAAGEGSPTAALEKALKAARLVGGIRSFGYAAARLDPLGSTTPSDPVLEAEFDGLSEKDLEYVPAGTLVGRPVGDRASSAREALTPCKIIYGGPAQKVVEAVERGMKSREASHPIRGRVLLRQTLHEDDPFYPQLNARVTAV
jgi:2-oxoglutarate dehydrogenase complex dehydrogenase (E1) component-like enzyme